MCLSFRGLKDRGIVMEMLSRRSAQDRHGSMAAAYVAARMVLMFFAFCCISPELPCAGEGAPLPAHRNDEVLTSIVNPFNATCYDWEGNIIPCVFKRPYAERIAGSAAPDSRFTDNRDGTVTDNMTNLVWLKHTNCFGIQDWQRAVLAAKSLEEGDCGPDPDLVLSDGSSAGDWRLPTMKELCTLIDFSNREPALPTGHMFSHPPIRLPLVGNSARFSF